MRVTISRTNNPDVVNPLYNHPRVFEILRCDGAPYPLDFSASITNPENFIFLASIDGEPGGVVEFDAEGAGDYDIHIAFLPKHWGKGIAPRACHMAIARMFDEGARRITAEIANHRAARPAFLIAKRIGFSVEGIRRGVFMRDGKVVDEYRMVLTPEAFERGAAWAR